LSSIAVSVFTHGHGAPSREGRTEPRPLDIDYAQDRLWTGGGRRFSRDYLFAVKGVRDASNVVCSSLWAPRQPR
jgi:hypothetical protein